MGRGAWVVASLASLACPTELADGEGSSPSPIRTEARTSAGGDAADAAAAQDSPLAPATTPMPAEVAEAPVEPARGRTPAPPRSPVMDALFAELPEAVRAEPDGARLQVLITEIAPGDSLEEPPRVAEHAHAVDRWFYYPASAIKTFAAVSALRRVQRMRAKGVRVDTPVVLCKAVRNPCHDPATADDDEALDDTNLDGGVITIEHEIRKMMLASDNRAFYRLFHFLGHQTINEDPWSLGFTSVRMFQPYWVVRSPERSRRTRAVELRPPGRDPVLVPRRVSRVELTPNAMPGVDVGLRHVVDGEVVDGPRSFAHKNYASLRDLHALTLAIARPDLPDAIDLGLTRTHRRLLRAAMTENPRRSKNPVYASARHAESRSKLMLNGLTESLARWKLDYLGKHGRAYGFVVESAHVHHRPSGFDVIVTAAVYADPDGTVGDDEYAYDTIAQPVFDALGRVIAARIRAHAEPSR